MSDDDERDAPAADETDGAVSPDDEPTDGDAEGAEPSGTDAQRGPPDADADPLDDLEAADPVEGDPFEEMDVDTDAVDGTDVLGADATDAEQAAAAEEAEDVRVISDRTCHNCEFFADPPALACNHEGTEIRRVVDTDHYEVVNCPMVLDEVDITDDL